MADYAALLPVNLVTGFLGSGKTTLLNRLLRAPQLARTAVLVNEFGEVGLDHLLLEKIDAETVLLPSGCVCCTIRGDLAEAIRSLFSRRERGIIPRFDRLAIETTGLADPAPIVSTLLAEPVLRHHFRLGNVIATVDAVNGARQLAEYPESVKQAAIADRIVLTKTELAEVGVGGAAESDAGPAESDRADPRCRERPARARRADGERRLRSRAPERRGAALAGRGSPRSRRMAGATATTRTGTIATSTPFA